MVRAASQQSSLYTLDGAGKLSLHLHPGQTKVWESQRRIVAMLAGTQSGKTSFGPWWLWGEMQRLGAGDYLAVTSSYDLFKLKMLPEMRRVFEETLGRGRYWSGDKIMELRPEGGEFQAKRVDDPMWGRIILRSAAAGGGLESATARAAWADEAGQDEFGLDAYEAIMRRLSLYQGRLLLTTTLYNLGWLKSQIYEPWERGDPDIDVIQFASTLNPMFPQAEYERAKRALPDWKFKMFYRGEFAKPAGLIYGDFDETRHWIAPFDIPAEWPRYVGIDFGAVHTATVWIAHDVERAAYYVYRETLEGGMTTKQHAAKALEYARRERVVNWAGGAKGEVQQRMDWAAEGVAAQEPPIADVEAQIDRVIGLFKQGQLFVFNTCAGLRAELGTYSRKLDANGEPTEDIKDKETFHRLDALRYAVAGLGGEFRWEFV